MSKDLTAEAVRLLLEAEWSDNSAGEYQRMCPWCGGGEPGYRGPSNATSDCRNGWGDGHLDGCRLVALLRTAGVR